MLDETFISYKKYRWMWFHLILVGVLIAVYSHDQPPGGRSGSTWVGFSYGALATAAILYLLWFGLRKRSHYSRLASLKGCLAVHVWLGLSLAVIVPLHCAFQFGPNVHTFAYVLMLGVIVSGVLGTRLYLTLPQTLKSNRGGQSVKALLEEFHKYSQEIQWLTRERSDQFLALVETVDFEYRPSIINALLKRKEPAPATKQIAALLSVLDDAERAEATTVVTYASRKHQLVEQLQEEVRTMLLFRSWLYVHIPLSYGLVMAVAVHIFSVYAMR